MLAFSRDSRHGDASDLAWGLLLYLLTGLRSRNSHKCKGRSGHSVIPPLSYHTLLFVYVFLSVLTAVLALKEQGGKIM